MIEAAKTPDTNGKEFPGPGLYDGIPAADYFAWPYLNNSTLKQGARSMAHLESARQHPREATPAMRLGTLIHSAALEPLELVGNYVVMPPFERDVRKPDGSEYSSPKGTKAYKGMVADFADENSDKQIITQDELDAMHGVVRAIKDSPHANGWLSSQGPVEACIVWDDESTGVRCKARIDKIAGDLGLVVDLKTTVDASQFERQIYNMSYHMQLAWYCDGLTAVTETEWNGAIIAVENTMPFGVRSAMLSIDAHLAGRKMYRALIDQYAECVRSQVWPSYTDPELWNLPGWARDSGGESVELLIGGELVGV